METKRKGPPRAAGADAIAAETPVPAKSPAEVAPIARAAAQDEQRAEIAAETAMPAESPAEVAAYASAPRTEPTPGQVAADEVSPDDMAGFASAGFAALAEAQAALARGLTAMSDAMAGLTRSGFDIAAGTVTDTLGVKTLSDAYRVNARFASRSFDSWLDGSAKLSGLGVKLVDEASRPILRQLGLSWLEAVHVGR